jgi:hypothetical protein
LFKRRVSNGLSSEAPNEGDWANDGGPYWARTSE